MKRNSHVTQDHIMKHEEMEREPFHSLTIMFTKGRSLDQAVTLAATIAASLLVSQDVTDHCIEANFLFDGGGHCAEIIDELLEIFPRFAFWADWMQSPEVILG